MNESLSELKTTDFEMVSKAFQGIVRQLATLSVPGLTIREQRELLLEIMVWGPACQVFSSHRLEIIRTSNRHQGYEITLWTHYGSRGNQITLPSAHDVAAFLVHSIWTDVFREDPPNVFGKETVSAMMELERHLRSNEIHLVRLSDFEASLLQERLMKLDADIEIERLLLIAQRDHKPFTTELPGVVVESHTPANHPTTGNTNGRAIEVLFGWSEILEELRRPDGQAEQRRILELNKTMDGPIQVARGSKVTAVREKLVHWWNDLYGIHAAKKAQEHMEAETRKSIESVPFGKTGNSVPEIGGAIKNKRVRK